MLNKKEAEAFAKWLETPDVLYEYLSLRASSNIDTARNSVERWLTMAAWLAVAFEAGIRYGEKKR